MLNQSVLADATTDRYNAARAMKQKIYNAAPSFRVLLLRASLLRTTICSVALGCPSGQRRDKRGGVMSLQMT